jgi:hypothetical protein
MEALVKKEFAKGRDPKGVAGLILRCAQSRAPRPVYLAGPDAEFMNCMKWLLPDKAYEWFLKRVFPWSRFP